jgi:three-Cys-motif partner protein
MMTPPHEFGGSWTEDKLSRLQKYLQAYMTIFSRNERARKLNPIYVDAFAGTGYRNTPRESLESLYFFPELTESENQEFLKGSACIALEVQPPFNQYLFIESNPVRVQELANLRNDFPRLANRIGIINQDANTYLIEWCQRMQFLDRAVIFLDPYGMQVEWSLLEAIAKTKKIDLWLLFPLGVAVMRLLTKSAPPSQAWSDSLTRLFGTDEWRDVFYHQIKQQTLFGTEEHVSRDADFEKISQFVVNRLKTIFPAVAEKPLPLRNSKNNPLYLLCFAAGNPTGSATALKIANYLLKA